MPNAATTNPTRPTTAQIDAVLSNCAVQVAAERLTAKQQLLAEITGSRAVIAAAIEATGTADPAAIVDALGHLAADTDAAWLNADVCAALDTALHANPQYAHARRIGQLHPLRLHWVADIHAHAAALARPEQRLATRKIALLLPPQMA